MYLKKVERKYKTDIASENFYNFIFDIKFFGLFYASD